MVALALAVRGWMRGFVREAIDLLVLVVGAAIVFRLSGPVGVVLSSMANVPYEAGRIGAGVVLFVGVVVAGWVIGKVIGTALHIVPGASLLNRIGGAFVGVVYAAVAAVFVSTLLGVAPLPDDLRTSTDEMLAASVVANEVNDPDGPTQQVVALVSGDSLIGAVLAVREAVGERLVAGTIPVPLPGVEPAELSPDPDAALVVIDRLNAARVDSDENPLARASDLDEVAVSRARRVYLSGTLKLDDRLSADLAAVGVPGSYHEDAVVIAASADGVAEALLSTSAYRELVEGGQFDRVGVGVIDGPVGLVGVIVLTP